MPIHLPSFMHGGFHDHVQVFSHLGFRSDAVPSARASDAPFSVRLIIKGNSVDGCRNVFTVQTSQQCHHFRGSLTETAR